MAELSGDGFSLGSLTGHCGNTPYLISRCPSAPAGMKRDWFLEVRLSLGDLDLDLGGHSGWSVLLIKFWDITPSGPFPCLLPFFPLSHSPIPSPSGSWTWSLAPVWSLKPTANLERSPRPTEKMKLHSSMTSPASGPH